MTAVSSCGSKEAPAGANPLLSEWDTPYGVPPFDKIKVSDYMPAFREAMKLHREEIKAIAENPEEPDFENTVLALRQRRGDAYARGAGILERGGR